MSKKEETHYKWEVEYKIRREKPNLPDDVLVQVTTELFEGWLTGTVGHWHWESGVNKVLSFRIIDERYKPVEQNVSVSSENNQKTENVSDWYDYDKQKAVALPPVGEKVEVFLHWSGKWSVWVLVIGHDNDGVVWRNGSDSKTYIHTPRNEIRPLDWNRKAEEDKERVVTAAAESVLTDAGLYVALEELYEKGFLKLPEQKK